MINLERYYSKKPVIEKVKIVNKFYNLKKIISTKTDGSYISKSTQFRSVGLVENIIIKNGVINVSLKRFGK